MKYGSVCSGIEAATVAWHPLGWTPAWFAEVEKFPSAVLAHHYPDTPNYGDMTSDEFREKTAADGPIDVLVGGTPCQSFSVAGLRGGLDDERGNLALEFCRLADRLAPRWVVWENVPGVLSSGRGRDFGSIVGALVKLGYGVAWRILDAQYFGVPQRRRRVFLVGHLGDAKRAAAVLFERHSLQGHPTPSREAREEVTPLLEVGARTNGDGYRDGDGIGRPGDPMYSLQASKQHGVAHTLRGEGFDASEDGSGRGTPLGAQDRGHAVAFDMRGRDGGAQMEGPHDTANIRAASGGSSRSYIASPMAVRRLTPEECEKLQGFSPGYTRIAWRGKAPEDCPDGPRYKALGNSMAVPVMRWIGERIEKVEVVVARSSATDARTIEEAVERGRQAERAARSAQFWADTIVEEARQ